MPFLVLVRHAKAEPHGADDRDRRLAEAGRRQCAELRTWLVEQEIGPDRVLLSSAARARETWELAAVGHPEVVVEDRLYQAGPDEVRELVSLTPAGVGTLVLVGHNPTFEDLAWELDDGEQARDLTARGMRTSGVGVFALASWDARYGALVAWR